MILDGVAGISVLLALFMALGWAPTDATMGHLQRIFYLHVSTAWVGFLALLMGLVGGILYLRKGKAQFDNLSQGGQASLEYLVDLGAAPNHSGHPVASLSGLLHAARGD